jgi:alkanesulfonate monooxygenase SsuD/methylene tetrahydromethanopterin reductase-like flavin-dependent oxidoreductase (luciferase family)
VTDPLAIPIGVNLTTIGVSAGWWLESARRLESAGFSTAWAWDHFVSRGRRSDPVLECWTTLAATAAVTTRLKVGSFVTNVMNRHPAVLARMAATMWDLSGGRVELGIGIGGHPGEHQAYGIDFPQATERAARLEEAVSVIRALWTGGPVDFPGRWWSLRDAYASPAPDPPPRIVIGGETAAGARLAARIGDAWTCFEDPYPRLLPAFEEALAAAGRRRTDVQVLVGLEVGSAEDGGASALVDLRATAAAWRERGADELVLHWVRPSELRAVLDAATRAGLAGVARLRGRLAAR